MKPDRHVPDVAAIAELKTVRDWLRYGTTLFTRAGLSFGHGTATALDEAAFLLLMVLDLPIDTLDPWLDSRLTTAERQAIAELFTARIVTRKPAAYLVKAAFIQGHRFSVDERVIVPRSYIGELLCGDGPDVLVPDPAGVRRVLDLCTGSGCLAILAALAFPEAQVDGVDLSAAALEVASDNVAAYELGTRVALHEGDLFAAVAPDARYDLIIANPPYVATAEVAAFTAEYRAEPVLAHAGGVDGLDLVRRILDQAGAHLTAEGALVVEIGTGREALEAAYPGLAFLWLETETSAGEVFAISAQALGVGP